MDESLPPCLRSAKYLAGRLKDGYVDCGENSHYTGQRLKDNQARQTALLNETSGIQTVLERIKLRGDISVDALNMAKTTLEAHLKATLESYKYYLSEEEKCAKDDKTFRDAVAAGKAIEEELAVLARNSTVGK